MSAFKGRLSSESPSFNGSGLLTRQDFPALLQALKTQKYRVLGPVVAEGSVKWEEVARVEDLPIGWRDHQRPGQYRLERTDSPRFFDIVHGPESIKRHVFTPRETLLVLERKKKTFSAHPVVPQGERVALLGPRACDLAGLAVQDRIFLKDQFADPCYQIRREHLLLIAVNCTRALETCFCASMGTGPKVQHGYDLVMTEADDGFVVRPGSEAGQEIYDQLPLRAVDATRIQEDEDRITACANSQVREMDSSQMPQALYDAHDHPRWDEVATRCLACTNCTMVCPTCFCSAVEETPDLLHQRSEHARVWDSCFTPDHGYIHGKNFRPTIKDRYRMWLTHKLASWIDQFGTSGCVGCGRCMTWCPVGIDLTEEVQVLLNTKTD